MNEPLTRGHFILKPLAFIEQHYDEETARKIFDLVPQEVLALRPDIKVGELYPRHHAVAISRAIAAVGKDEESVYKDLVACGRYMGNEASNTYLKLLLKILTPSLMARKLPTFWERDNKHSGNFDPKETKVEDSYMRLKMVDTQGFEHAAPLTAGFCSFILDMMGKKGIKATQQGWSLQEPGPDSFVLEITWG
jgi:hypothetical protein